MLAKPSTCSGCVLETAGRGYAPAVGPQAAPILFVGEALGWDEAERGEPFIGAAGGLLDRVLRMTGIDRSTVRIDNTVRCQPPKNKLDGTAYESSAVATCSQYLDQTLAEGHKVVVPLGKSAIRRILGVPKKGTKVQDFHGTVQRDPTDRFWVVPSFHPSYIQRGAFNLIGTMSFDFQVVLEVARGEQGGGWRYPDFPSLVIDPSPEWFRTWVEMYEAAAAHDPSSIFLHIDTETEEKLLVGDEGELNIKAKPEMGDRIVRWNFACGPDEGVTVPDAAPYRPLIARLLVAAGAKWFHNRRFDVPRIKLHGYALRGPILDSMWAWHVLQSDLPRGLGYIAPFYSRLPAWKHLNKTNEGYYAAMDAVQGWRVAYGIARDLKQLGMWEVYTRHLYEYDEIVLFPAEEVGLEVDRAELERFRDELRGRQGGFLGALQEIVPLDVKPLVPKEGWVNRPDVAPDATEVEVTVKSGKTTRRAMLPLINRTVRKPVNVCHTCNAVGVQRRHRCTDKAMVPAVSFEMAEVVRWYARAPFSPNSPKQILAYMATKGHKPGKAKKSDAPTTDKDTLQKLAKSTKDPFYRNLLDFRAVNRVLTTYVVGTLDRLDDEDRVHAQFLHVPSTLRLSCRNPNLQNVIADRPGGEALANGFRNCIVAGSGCELSEADAAGIEAVLVGYFCKDADYIRLAQRGIHAYVTSHLVGKPADKNWPDSKLVPYLREIKEAHKAEYAKCKRTVHLSNYGGTPKMMVLSYPDTFRTEKEAAKLYDLYLTLCPNLKPWWKELRARARMEDRIGGPGDHPYGYLHWFYNLTSYNRIAASSVVRTKSGALQDRNGNPVIEIAPGRFLKVGQGEDAKRVVAFKPQSTARGVQTEVAFRLFRPGMPNYLGDIFYGRTPLRALIHDSLLLEHLIADRARVHAALVEEMTRPIEALPFDWLSAEERAKHGFGTHLQIGVEVKVGKSWGKMESVIVSQPGVDLAADAVVPVDETDDEDEDAGEEELYEVA